MQRPPLPPFNHETALAKLKAAYNKPDLRDLEYYLIDTGHFALESHGQEIAELMRSFLTRKVENIPMAAN